MSLSPAAPRHLIHTRKVTCKAYQREDGLWDIEGHMTDIKTTPLPNIDRGGVIPAGEPVHEMWLRITIDSQLLIHQAEAATEYSPFSICPTITPAYKALEGLRIGPGWNRKVKEVLGRAKGCTHHSELLGPMATTAYQALYEVLSKQEAETNVDKPPAIMNTCHALAETSPIAERLWPEHARNSTSQALNEE